jgi:hypothetical protein
MATLITAERAFALANPSDAEGLARYQDSISDAITEAAMAQIVTINLRVPVQYSGTIQCWLADAGYNTTVVPDELEDWAFLNVSWGRS